jgi:hypothetical protein
LEKKIAKIAKLTKIENMCLLNIFFTNTILPADLIPTNHSHKTVHYGELIQCPFGYIQQKVGNPTTPTGDDFNDLLTCRP